MTSLPVERPQKSSGGRHLACLFFLHRSPLSFGIYVGRGLPGSQNEQVRQIKGLC
jgi:hypothetical protein